MTGAPARTHRPHALRRDGAGRGVRALIRLASRLSVTPCCRAARERAASDASLDSRRTRSPCPDVPCSSCPPRSPRSTLQVSPALAGGEDDESDDSAGAATLRSTQGCVAGNRARRRHRRRHRLRRVLPRRQAPEDRDAPGRRRRLHLRWPAGPAPRRPSRPRGRDVRRGRVPGAPDAALPDHPVTAGNAAVRRLDRSARTTGALAATSRRGGRVRAGAGSASPPAAPRRRRRRPCACGSPTRRPPRAGPTP